MKRFVLTPRAERDVNEIWDYIADDNIEAADRVLMALERAMRRLADIRAVVTRGVGGQAAPLLAGLFRI